MKLRRDEEKRLKCIEDLEALQVRNSIDIRYLDELESWLKANCLSAENVCLVGSSALAANGIRKNHDLEIAIKPDCYKKINRKYQCAGLRGSIPISRNVELFKNQFAYIGILDKDIFERELYEEIQGYHVIILELEYLYKKSLRREKDKKDVLSIIARYPEINSSARRYRIWYKGIFRIWNKVFKGVLALYNGIIECISI